MKRIIKSAFLTLFCLSLLSIVFGSGYLYFFDSSIKGNYYFDIAVDLDDKNPKGSGEAVRYYNKAIKTYLNAGDKSGAIQAYINLGLLHYKFGNSLQVERMVLAALDLGKENIPESMRANIYLLLASTSEPEKARKYIEQSLEISKRLHLNSLTAQAYYLQAVSYEYKADFEAAEESYLSAIEAVEGFSTIGSSFDVANLYSRLGELYAGGGETENAIKYYSAALSYSLRDERSFVTANYMKIIGDLYEEKKNMAKACEMWQQSTDEYAFFGAAAPFSTGSCGANSMEYSSLLR